MANNRRAGIVKKSPSDAAAIRASMMNNDDDDDDDGPFSEKKDEGHQMEAGANQEYAQNNYWPSPDQISIDDIDLDDF